MPIARTVAEAQVGDLLWRWDGNASRYDENRKWLGRGVWSLVTVTKIARVYITAGDPEYPRSGEDYHIDTGTARTRNEYTPPLRLAGWKDRADGFWRSRAVDFSRAIASSEDVELLKTVAFALGLEGPPDYSIEPPKEPKKP